MGKRIYITDRLFFENGELFENEKIVPIGKNRHRKILEYLVNRPNEDVPYEILYRNCFVSHRADNYEDYGIRVERAMRDLYNMSPALKDCIQKEAGCWKLRIAQPLRLIPLFTQGRDNADRAFPRCPFYEPRTNILMDIQSRAFTSGQAFLIYGPPGIGKTELAREFARIRCRAGRYRFVLSAKYNRSLRGTILSLPTEETTKTEKQYEDFLEKLEALQKLGQVLLIVDNMDIDTKAFEADQDVFQQLCRMGLHILFTSRNPLDAYFADASAALSPMEPDILESLFRRVAGENNCADPAQLRELIETGLLGNTYLVVLAGFLVRKTGVDALKDAILKGNRESDALREDISLRKDGELKTDTLMGHLETLYRLGTTNNYQRKVMSVLCMLPLDGIDRQSLLERGFRSTERDAARAALNDLLDAFWIIRSDGGRLCLHPTVRQMILARYFRERDVREYVDATAKALYEPSYSANLMPQLLLADAAYAVIKDRKLDIPETACLLAQLASTWDTLTDYKKAYDYGMPALPLLDAVKRPVDIDSLYWLAICYNVVGYALDHTKTDCALARAAHALNTAEALVNSALAQTPSEDLFEKLTVLRSKIRSNLAANHLASGDYRGALACHEQVLADRLDLLERYGGEKYEKMVAASCKNIGTVQYYLAAESLKASYDSHRKAVGHYRAAEMGIQSDLHCVAIHRAVGSMLCLMEMWDRRKIEQLFSVTLENQLLSVMREERKVMDYLVRNAPISNELVNGFQNACKVLTIARLNGIPNAELSDIAEDILCMQFRIPEVIKKQVYPAVQLLGMLM